MHHFIRALYIAVALVNLLPSMGVLGAPWLESLYGLRVEGDDLLLLARHRAALFGLTGGLLLAAAFAPEIRILAAVMGLLSMLSFVVLALPLDAHGAAIQRVFWVDVVASVLLAIAAGFGWRHSER